MKLPNGHRTHADIQKLQGYCLNPHHARGRNKARVFASVGIGQADAELLRNALLAAAGNAEARTGFANPYGESYIVDFDLIHHADRENPQHVDGANRRRLAAADELLSSIEDGELAMADIEMLSVVALLEDVPREGLVRGQVGTIVEKWAPGFYEVEFCDDEGRTYAMVALKAEQVMRLHHEPTHQAA
jgi:hypothetical protein